MVVFGLGKELLFKSVLGHCAKLESNMNRSMNTVITTDLFITDNFSCHLTLAFKRGTPFPQLAFFSDFLICESLLMEKRINTCFVKFGFKSYIHEKLSNTV